MVPQDVQIEHVQMHQFLMTQMICVINIYQMENA